jgi:putative hemolysin
MKQQVIDIKDMESLSPIFKGKMGYWLAKRIMLLFAINKLNEVYEHSSVYSGAAFAASVLNELGVQFEIGNIERLNQLPEGAFITVCNHPYGGLDGIMLINLMADIRQDYKLMVNKLLSFVKTMDENFISVTTVTTKKPESTANINGIRETLTRLQNGHPVGFFPSGAVSDFSIKDFRVRDREWQENIIRLIKIAKVPIVPIRFFDKNSTLFYFLGLINWRIRLMRMPHEIFNKNKQIHRIGIGEIISVEEQNQCLDIHLFGNLLRKAVYNIPKPASFTPRSFLDIQLKKKRAVAV